jgi:hypothetical protein
LRLMARAAAKPLRIRTLKARNFKGHVERAFETPWARPPASYRGETLPPPPGA